MLDLFIDADGNPMKEETIKVALRYDLTVYVVANKYMNLPLHNKVKSIVVEAKFDAADDWISEKVNVDDIVITGDILLAQRCLLKKARVLNPRGSEYSDDNIGHAVAMRELSQDLRSMGEIRGGPSAMNGKHRSEFLSQLDTMIQQIKKKKKREELLGGKF